MDKETVYHAAFSHCLHIGPVRFSLLYRTYGSAHAAYNAPHNEIINLIGERCAESFNTFKRSFAPFKKVDDFSKKGIRVIGQHDSAYPAVLRQISDPPISLFVKGNSKALSLLGGICIGIVGSRMPSSYGTYLSRQFARELSRCGLVIVSGLAIGIDASAHGGALETGMATIAVLGCGTDVVYPPVNYPLYEKIAGGGGLIVSEFPPGYTVRKEFFVLRNRIISGLSRGVLVVEGSSNSGTLITAKYAAAQGREVYAPPVPTTSVLSQAPSLLLKQGAKFVTCAQDILDDLGLKERKTDSTAPDLTEKERVIVDSLAREAKSINELAGENMGSISELTCYMSTLELKGMVSQNSEGRYEVLK